MSEPKRFAVIRKYKKQDNFQILEWFHTIEQCKDFLIKQEMSDIFDLEIMKYGDMSKEKEIGGYQPIGTGKDPEPPPDDPSGLREEREAKEYISTGSAPGTCCPDQKYVSDICSGCGGARIKKAKEVYHEKLSQLPQGVTPWPYYVDDYIKELLNEIQYARKCNKSLSSRISKLNKIIDILK